MADLWTLVLLLAVSGFSLLAYSLHILDARGALASFVLGFVIVFAGGLSWLVVMALFTGIAFMATRFGHRHKERHGLAEPRDGERGVGNVVGNGLAPALAALAALFMDPLAARLAFLAAVATITVDTLGSEVGTLSGRARLILPPFEERRAGANGAVSLLGQSMGLLGAVVIAMAGMVLMDVPVWGAIVVGAAGFLGGQLDSLLGATLEKDHERPERPLTKQDVNFLASFIPALVVLIAAQLAQG